jgi:hypothetical protein
MSSAGQFIKRMRATSMSEGEMVDIVTKTQGVIQELNNSIVEVGLSRDRYVDRKELLMMLTMRYLLEGEDSIKERLFTCHSDIFPMEFYHPKAIGDAAKEVRRFFKVFDEIGLSSDSFDEKALRLFYETFTFDME